MQNESVKQAAALLVEVRRDNRRLTDLPADLQPANIADAYAVQDAAMALQGPIGGWKVAPASGGVEPTCAPVAVSHVHASPATLTGGELLIAPEIEVEIAVRLATDLPPRSAPYTSNDVAAAIGSIHPALEVLSSRFADRNAVPPLAAIADGQSNGAIVFGPGIGNWRGVEFSTVAMSLLFDGKQVGSADGGPSTASVLGVLAWLAHHAAPRSGGLRAGQVIITGARIKPVMVPGGRGAIVAEVAGIGTVSAKIE